MSMWMYAVSGSITLLLSLGLAPLLQGWIKKVKAFWQMRHGPSVFQPYRDLRKLWFKEEVISEHASRIFSLTPLVVMASTIMAALLVPNPFGWAPLHGYGDLFWLVASLALGRFFLTLAGVDTAGTFGGMGMSRELFVAVLVEPVFLLSLVVLALMTGTTSLQGISLGLLKYSVFDPPRLLAVLALSLVTIAEMGRIPVDNPDTHLELTMIHEGMLLEYSGRSLALLNWAEQLKQFLLIQFLVLIAWPTEWVALTTPASYIYVYLLNLAKLALAGAIFATIESVTVKLRLFRLPNFLSAGAAAAILALITFWVVRGGI